MNGNGIISKLAKRITQPFNQQIDVVQLFLITGLVMVSAFLWTRVMRHVEM